MNNDKHDSEKPIEELKSLPTLPGPTVEQAEQYMNNILGVPKEMLNQGEEPDKKKATEIFHRFFVERMTVKDFDKFKQDYSTLFFKVILPAMEEYRKLSPPSHEKVEEKCVPYQTCPKCQGQGIVSKPPYVAGDVQRWDSSDTSFPCDVCNGARIIHQAVIESPTEPQGQEELWDEAINYMLNTSGESHKVLAEKYILKRKE